MGEDESTMEETLGSPDIDEDEFEGGEMKKEKINIQKEIQAEIERERHEFEIILCE